MLQFITELDGLAFESFQTILNTLHTQHLFSSNDHISQSRYTNVSDQGLSALGTGFKGLNNLTNLYLNLKYFLLLGYLAAFQKANLFDFVSRIKINLSAKSRE